MGRDGIFDPGSVGLQLSQASQCSAQVALDYRPEMGLAFLGDCLQSRAVGGDGLHKPLGATFSLGQGCQGNTKGVLYSGPLKRCVPARIYSDRFAVGFGGLFKTIRRGFPFCERLHGIAERGIESSPAFGFPDRVAFEQRHELCSDVSQSLFQYVGSCIGLGQQSGRAEGGGGDLRSEFFVEIFLQPHVNQLVRFLVTRSQGVMPVTSHEPHVS